MPVWRIFSNPGTFTPEQRASFAKDITDYYVNSVKLPAFYVNVFFTSLEPDECFIGGEPRKNFVRVSIEHLARHYPEDKEARKAGMDRLEKILKPHIADRGDLDWEHNVIETPPDLWRIQGITPPAIGSKGFALWKEGGRAVPYDS